MPKIAFNSQGMFLYTRLLCDFMVLNGDMKYMAGVISRNDLPTGLDEAYARILSRISDFEQRAREDAQQILAMTAGCEVPLTKHEIRLGLLISRGGSPLQSCEDGYIQFVHFTAHEYLLGPQSDYYLNQNEIQASLSSICLKYLNSSCFNLELEDDVFRKSVLNGSDIAFFDFMGDLCYELATASGFFKLRKSALCFTDERRIQDLDPFTISTTQLRFRHVVEEMLCVGKRHRSDCLCTILKGIYGERIWKCARPGCTFFRIGFQTKARRDRHMQAHNRPFKCDQEGLSQPEAYKAPGSKVSKDEEAGA
ncbi:hypothetical protein CGMCC3_g430 [Colletotrichum fructicola]|nr:uncharacterized protein CGMCC3_g430 [Colletotrichum fructicola]KAE9583425.1 hypothetical protein CGMCC3_g430 [Colletotrichum fructicola]